MARPKVVTLQNLKAGKTVWIVNALDEDSFMLKVLVQSKPIKDYFTIVKAVSWLGDIKLNRDFILEDVNVVKKFYCNHHKVFYTENAAKRYLEQCIKYKLSYY